MRCCIWALGMALGICCTTSLALGQFVPFGAQPPAPGPVQPGKAVNGKKAGKDKKQSQADKAEEEMLKPYLTPEGNLRASVMVRDEEKGFGTFWGIVWQVNPNGAWVVTFTYLNQPRSTTSGQLTKAQLRALAKTLAQNNALSLPSAGTPYVNPHVLTVASGGHVGQLIIGVDQSLPPPTTAAQGSIVNRYSAIMSTVQGLINASNGQALRFPPPRPSP